MKKAPQENPSFSPKFRLAVAFILGMVAGGTVLDKCSTKNESCQPKQSGIADVSDGEMSISINPETKFSELSEEDILRMAKSIEETRDEWAQVAREIERKSRPEPIPLTSQELAEVFNELFKDFLGWEDSKRMAELMDMDRALIEASRSGSDGVLKLTEEIAGNYAQLNKTLSAAKDKEGKIQAMASFLCGFYSTSQFDLKDELECIYNFDLDMWEKEMSDEETILLDAEIERHVEQDIQTIEDNQLLRGIINKEFFSILEEDFGPFEEPIDEDYDDNWLECENYVVDNLVEGPEENQ